MPEVPRPARLPRPARGKSSAQERLEILRAEARYHRERYELYRAKGYGLRPIRETRARELERARDLAQERLEHAEREQRQAGPLG